MAVPTVYTEAELKAYVHGELGPVAEALTWTVAGGSYDEVVNDALLAYGNTDISEITGAENVEKLRRFAMLVAWRRVLTWTAIRVDFAADGTSVSCSQLHDMAKGMVERYESITAVDSIDYTIGVQRIDRPHNPYASFEFDERLL